MTSIPYAFYSYSLFDHVDELLPSMHFKVFDRVKKKPVAYRTLEDDKNTQLVKLKRKKMADIEVISFYILKKIDERKITVYDEEADEFSEKTELTEDYASALVVAVPSLKKMAAADRSGVHDINAAGAMSRLKKIISTELDGYKLMKDFAASEADVRSVFIKWKIMTVSFNARPFNPHPHVPGLELSNLLAPNNAKVRGVITANKDEWLRDHDKGIINEIIGLGEKGYGEFGAAGVTDKGFRARIDKAKIDEHSTDPRKIRVYFPERSDLELHIEDVVSAMLKIYGHEEPTD